MANADSSHIGNSMIPIAYAREELIEFFTVGAGTCTCDCKDTDNGYTLCITVCGGSEPGDYVELNITDITDSGVSVNGTHIEGLNNIINYCSNEFDRQRDAAC